MAGAGRRTFVPGEVLTASNVNSYLMDQAVMVFDDATERDVALGTAVVSEGMVSYLGNTNALSFYDGAAWRTLGSVSGLPVVAGGTGGTTVAAAQNNLGVASGIIAYGEQNGSNSNNSSTSIANLAPSCTATVVKVSSSTKLYATGVIQYSPQNAPTDQNEIYVQINGTDYKLLGFNSGSQFSLQQRSGAAVITGIPAGTYTATFRYKVVGTQNLFCTSWGKSFLTVTEVI
jgi:hypothetical protein